MRAISCSKSYCEPLESRCLLAAQLFADISATGLSPRFLTPLNNEMIFAGTTPASGEELWISDGTSNGTKMLKEIRPGPDDAGFTQIARSGSYVYFVASDGGANHGLWRTDGTTAGTLFLKQFKLQDDSSVSELTDFNGTLLFSAGSALGSALWKSNGTPAGTVRVKGSLDLPRILAHSTTTAYFQIDSATQPLWKTDGTTKGTVPVAGVTGNWFFSEAQMIGSDLYIAGNLPGQLYHALWKLDPKQGLVSLHAYEQVDSLTNVNGSLWFLATGTNDDPESLWHLTPKGVRSVFNPNDGLGQLTVLDGNVLTIDNYRKLCLSDPAKGTTSVIKDFGTSLIRSITIDGKQAVLALNTGTHSELWVTDGTAAGSRKVVNVPFEPDAQSGIVGPYIVPCNGRIFFRAKDPTGNLEMWSSNLTKAGTGIVKDFNGGLPSSNPGNLLAVGNTLYFTSNFGSGEPLSGNGSGTFLWKTDGHSPPQLLKMFDRTGQNFEGLFAVDDTVLAVVSDPDNHGEQQLWTVNGPNGFARISHGQQFMHFYGAIPGHAFFTTGAQTLGVNDPTGLWVTDGTAKGTVQLIDHTNDNQPGFGTPLLYHGKLYFVSSDVVNGVGQQQLYSSDGTLAGTAPVTTWFDDSQEKPKYIGDWCIFQNQIYFDASTTAADHSLWRTDGTAAGTNKLMDASGLFLANLTVAGQLMFFSARDNNSEETLYRTDGTVLGTTQVAPIPPPVANTIWDTPKDFISVGNLLYYKVEGFLNSVIQYASDGTLDGTKPMTLWTDYEFVWKNHLYMLASNGLFRADGASVHRVTALPAEAYAQQPVVLGDRVFFAANDPKLGRELWYYQSDGAISGNVFDDTNSNGTRQSGEPTLPGIQVFLDQNHDGILNGHEWSAVTGADGWFLIGDLSPGSYDLRLILPAGYSATTPLVYTIALAKGATIAKGFGVTPPPTPI